MVRSLLLACALSHAEALDKILLPESYGAHCLDGSAASYYYGAPSSGHSSVWVVWMEGGGGCTDEKKCKARAKTQKGSSKDWKATITGGSAILDPSEATNPDFHDAHHVYVKYCTGDEHRGQVLTPTAEQWGFYFSGHLNFKSIMQHLFDTQSAAQSMQRVLLSGGSAGAVGAYHNCDFLQAFLAEAGSDAQVSCAPVSGWFFPGFTEDHDNPLMPPSNWSDWSNGRVTSLDPSGTSMWLPYSPKECVEALAPTGEALLCGTTQAVYPHIQAPVYVLQNWFDYNQIFAQLQLPKEKVSTTQGREFIAYFGRAMALSKDVVTQHPYGKTGDGLFLASCLDHGGSVAFGDDVRVQGHNSFEALGDWFFGRGRIPAMLVDDCQQPAPGLPCNSMCPNVPGPPTPSPTPSPTPAPSPSGDCPAWCGDKPQAWSVKCAWTGCVGCAECRGDCESTFRSLCGDTMDTKTQCGKCAQSHQDELAAVGCTQDQVKAICENAIMV